MPRQRQSEIQQRTDERKIKIGETLKTNSSMDWKKTIKASRSLVNMDSRTPDRVTQSEANSLDKHIPLSIR